jgi:hypothetical protein
VDVFRPFPTAEDLAEGIQQARPDWRQRPNLVRLMMHLQSPIIMTRHRLAASHPRQAFAQSMGVDVLPPIEDDRLVVELLTGTVFRSALDTAWRNNSNGLFTCAPTTNASFHIVPPRYDAGFVEVDPVSCMRCHETVGQHAQSFEFGRDWYGRVRGSDGIFSFHPFSLGSISFNGIGQSVSMRAELEVANVLERYDARRHPRRIYQRLE